MANIIVFLIALFGVAVILLSKYIELRTGKRTLLQRVLDRLNGNSALFISGIKYRIFQFIQIIRFIILVKLPEKGRVSYNEARDVAAREYEKKREVLMGRKVLKNNGSVSFFLKKIKQDVSHGEGRIEEE
jgi:hypothetical protein